METIVRASPKSVTFLLPAEVVPIEVSVSTTFTKVGNKSSPNKSPSPHRRPNHNRDSLEGRLKKKKGKPGSRKNNRWLNEIELGRSDNELSDPGPPENEYETYLFEENAKNIFYKMFEDDQLMEMWRPFLDVTEEEEKMLLQFEMEEDSDDEDYYMSPYTVSYEAYQRISTQGKRSFEKYFESELLFELDTLIYEFINNPSLNSSFSSDNFTAFVFHEQLSLTMKTSFHRMMAHSICTFYNASSHSLEENGSKTIVVSAPETTALTPDQSLLEYLNDIRNNGTFSDKPIRAKSTRSKPKRKSNKRKPARQLEESQMKYGVIVY